MATIILRDVTRRFGTTAALASIDLTVESGRFAALVGPSGCGKSTLLRLIAGLDRPTTGTVSADGRTVDGPGPERGVVFQQPALFPWLDVAANIRFGLDEAGMVRTEADRRVAGWIAAVGLEGFERSLPAQLSGGMAQRAALARALAPAPGTLLLDEPFGALDRITRNEMQDLLVQVRAATPATVLLVTHDVEEAVYLADRVIVLSPRPGRIVADLPVDLPAHRVRTDPAFMAVRVQVEQALQTAMV
ncbi:ABC transporter related protein [alpha proteobacterium BAL199]|jgi:ABC-type nitrate/sulfonate/bicarbonate transport system ATPase subunit|nr:ABC transporter related protein [alpha proteobacterium BAL199]